MSEHVRPRTAADDDAAAERSAGGLPILAPPGASPALASDPLRELDHSHHAYEANPAPWWMAIVWLTYLVGGAVYLVVNLMR
jgi:hypothetical protein